MNIFKRNKLLLIGTLLIGTLLVIHACVSYQNATIKNEKDLKNIQLSNNYAMLVVLNNDTHLGGEDYSINIPGSNKDFNIILRKEFLLVDPGVQKISYYRGRNK